MRILGIFSTVPMFGSQNVPVMSRIGLGIALTLLVAPNLPPFAEQDPMSWHGLLILIHEFIIGIAIGFSLQLVFAGFDLAGELMAMSMGIGFASFYDPQTKGQSPAISQFITMQASLLFIATDLHLLLIENLLNSFKSLPIGETTLNKSELQQLAFWGGHIFSIGLQLALPLITALLITNMALGVLTRAAPQLNIFGVGFPITLSTGYLMLYCSQAYLATPLLTHINTGLEIIEQLIQLSP
jgi:flagellar biosynthetic protein FliR